MSYGKGHCKGTKREKKHAQAWYRAIESDNIRHVEQQALAAYWAGSITASVAASTPVVLRGHAQEETA